MRDSQKYLLIGAFILATTVILVGVWLWFSSNNRLAYDTYAAVFHEPVDGISTSSVVKYNGVEVGRVKQISLDKNNPNNITVYINVLAHTPITTNTYATMKPQGITGLSYIDLRMEDNLAKAQIIQVHNSPPYPVLTTKPSLLYGLSSQAQSVTNNIQDISLQAKLLLNDKNLQHISNIVTNLDHISKNIANHTGELNQTIANINQVLLSIKDNSKQVNMVLNSVGVVANNLNTSALSLNTMLNTVQSNTLANINGNLLPNMNQALDNINQVTQQLAELLAMLNQNPSSLIRGQAPLSKGPGE